MNPLPGSQHPRRARSPSISRLFILMLTSWSLILVSFLPMAGAFPISPQRRASMAKFVCSPLSMNTKNFGSDDGYDGLGEYDPSEDIRPKREVLVGDPQIKVKTKDQSITNILKELAAIQQQGPQKYCILGTRHCSYLHQQIIELLYVGKRHLTLMMSG